LGVVFKDIKYVSMVELLICISKYFTFLAFSFDQFTVSKISKEKKFKGIKQHMLKLVNYRTRNKIPKS